jgi:hypothetical protein
MKKSNKAIKPRGKQAHGAAPQRNRGANRRKVHRELVARRLEGGAPPTVEAYARALEQWQHLPGAIGAVHVPNFKQVQTPASSGAPGGAAPSISSDARKEGRNL